MAVLVAFDVSPSIKSNTVHFTAVVDPVPVNMAAVKLTVDELDVALTVFTPMDDTFPPDEVHTKLKDPDPPVTVHT